MILRASIIGFIVWLAITLIFRFTGQSFFHPGEAGLYLLFGASPLVMAVLTVLVLRVLGEAKIDRAEAAIAFALPGMLLDVYAMNAFPDVFPNLDASLDGAFAAMKFLGYGAILIIGLVTSRIAPSDERL
jgi:hypothetical protein